PHDQREPDRAEHPAVGRHPARRGDRGADDRDQPAGGRDRTRERLDECGERMTTAPAQAETDLSTVLTIDRLHVSAVGGDEILHGIALDLYRGRSLGLVGESGAGKTTAGLACLGHYRTGLVHTAGDIELHPRDGGTITLSQLSTDEVQQL